MNTYLQHLDLDSGFVINLHPFGEDLTELLWDEPVINVLNGMGWLDGGCLVLANALDTWSRGALKPIAWVWPDPSLPDGLCASHYAMTLDLGDGELAVLDGNGVGTLADFERIMAHEHAHHEHRDRAFTLLDASNLYRSACEGKRPDIEANLFAPTDPRAFLVSQELMKAFGPFDPDLILLAWPEGPQPIKCERPE